MRIYKDRYYIRAAVPGVSGFQRWADIEYHIVTGAKARTCRSDIVAEWHPRGGLLMRCEDGRFPRHQTRRESLDAARWLDANAWAAIVQTDRATGADVTPAEIVAGRLRAEGDPT